MITAPKNRKVVHLAPNLSKILVAVDGSEHSDYALNVAAKVGEKFSSAVNLCMWSYLPLNQGLRRQ